MLFCFRKIGLVIGIGRNYIHLDSVFQRTVNIDMILSDCTALTPQIIKVVIELLELKRSDFAEKKMRKFSVEVF